MKYEIKRYGNIYKILIPDYNEFLNGFFKHTLEHDEYATLAEAQDSIKVYKEKKLRDLEIYTILHAKDGIYDSGDLDEI